MILLTVLQRALGYYPGNPGWEVAEIAVSKGKNVDECKKILGVPWIGMGPSVGEQRRECIREYASLVKEPEICKLLFPSEYGLSCISNVISNLFIDTAPGTQRVEENEKCEQINNNPLRRDYCYYG